jgi:hypothetical protein
VTPANAAALVAAGLLSVLVYPALALRLLPRPAVEVSGATVPRQPIGATMTVDAM